jgi:hypothetical protein
MPNWVEYVREHLSLPNCPPEREACIVEELAQQLDEAYRESLQLGLSEQEAISKARLHVSDWPALSNDLERAGIHRSKKLQHCVPEQQALSEMNRDVPACSSRRKIQAPESTKDGGSFGIAAMVNAVRQDLHYGGRMLGRKPLFTFAAILTLAIGIGANSTIFSVVNSVLLQRLPYPESNRLAVIWSAFGKEQRAPSSGPELISLRERSHLFDQFAGIWVQSAALTGQGEPEQVRLGFVTSNFLSLLSARSHAGRSFLPQEDGSDKSPVVVLSYDLWRRRYASDPRIVGQSILVSGRLCTVVGVLPAGFKLIFPEGASVPPSVGVYVPFQWDLAKQSRDQGYIRVIGRLRDGTTMRQGQAELDNIAAQLRSEFREYSEQNLGLQALSLQGDVARNARPSLLVLFAGTGLVLLIACANVAILLIRVLTSAGTR